MLMMVDPHVHFHVIPRYSESREWAGMTLADQGVDLLLDRGARADDRHLPPQHVHEVGQLVEREAAQEGADARDARVVVDLEERPAALHLVLVRELEAPGLGVLDHRPELHDPELAPAAPVP